MSLLHYYYIFLPNYYPSITPYLQNTITTTYFRVYHYYNVAVTAFGLLLPITTNYCLICSKQRADVSHFSFKRCSSPHYRLWQPFSQKLNHTRPVCPLPGRARVHRTRPWRYTILPQNRLLPVAHRDDQQIKVLPNFYYK